MDKYNENGTFFNVNLISAINNNIFNKKLIKVSIGSFIISIPFLIFLVLSIIFNPSLITVPIIGLLSSLTTSITTHIFTSKERMNEWKNYCDDYKLYKNKDGRLLKILLKSGKEIIIDCENAKVVGRGDLSDLETELESLNHQNQTLEKDKDNLLGTIKKLQDENNLLEYQLDSMQEGKKSNEKKSKNEYTLMNNHKYSMDYSIGRENEIKMLEESLVMKSVNPLIIGPSGVGKTALVDGLVYKIQKGDVPEFLKGQKIGKIDAAELVSGCNLVGMFEEKMKGFIKYAKKENIIFFIDEFHTLMGAGAGSKSDLDAANILKSYLSDGQLKIIGATTEKEYEEHIKDDSAFARRFEVIRLDEPNKENLNNILNAHIKDFENTYRIKFTNSDTARNLIIDLLIQLTNKKHRKYNVEVNNPSLIINIVERSFVKASMDNNKIVSIKNICDAIISNPNIYKSEVDEIVKKLEGINIEETFDNDSPQKLIKFKRNNN